MKMHQAKHTLTAERDAAVAKAHEHLTNAARENRALEDAERAEVDQHLAKAEELKARIVALEGDDTFRERLSQFQSQKAAASTEHRAVTGSDNDRRGPLSFGEQFIKSETYGAAVRGKKRMNGWTSGEIEMEGSIGRYQAATLTTDGASGGDLVFPNYTSNLIPLNFERLTVADLMASGETDSPTIFYQKETTATNAAATVAEGAAKPESTLIFDSVSDTLKKIATVLPVSDEMLDDAAQIRSYIDSRLRFFIAQQEEAQLLNGDGLGTNLTGLRNRVGLAADVLRGTDTNADAIFKQIMAIMTSAFVQPDGIILHPANWQAIALSKDTAGNYLGAGPFNTPLVARLWGLPVVLTTAITSGVALVGSFRPNAQVFRKGGITVEATNSHASFFVENKTMIRAEERVALAVYRPGAFGEVTGLN